MESNSDNSEQYFDRKRLSARLMGDEELVTQILQACLPELNANFQDYAKALEADRMEEALIRIHAMKGSAQNADLVALSDLTLRIEYSLRSGEERLARESLASLEELLHKTVTEVRRHLSGEV